MGLDHERKTFLLVRVEHAGDNDVLQHDVEGNAKAFADGAQADRSETALGVNKNDLSFVDVGAFEGRARPLGRSTITNLATMQDRELSSDGHGQGQLRLAAAVLAVNLNGVLKSTLRFDSIYRKQTSVSDLLSMPPPRRA